MAVQVRRSLELYSLVGPYPGSHVAQSVKEISMQGCTSVVHAMTFTAYLDALLWAAPLPTEARAVHHVYMSRKSRPPTRINGKPRYRLTFIRQWREAKLMTLQQLAGRVSKKTGGMTHASLSLIERGLQPYSQPILEAIADELTDGDVVPLLISDPTESKARARRPAWSRATNAKRKRR